MNFNFCKKTQHLQLGHTCMQTRTHFTTSLQVNTESDDAHIYPGSYKEFSLQCFDTWFGQQEGHPACKKLDVGLSLVTI